MVGFDPKIDWDKLNDELDDDEVFVLCRHPFMKQEYLKGRFLPRVKDYTDDPTPELLAVADVVITDYSTIVFDASLLLRFPPVHGIACPLRCFLFFPRQRIYSAPKKRYKVPYRP